ncbi:MAG: two pore domain potassium channel family protein [Saprospiraceae bacterium]|nr:two pore domain potassium channel family protein [Saprospiraceae bacterium]
MKIEANNSNQPITLLNIVVLLLSLYVLVSIGLGAFFNLNTEVKKILVTADNIICAVFLFDFCYRFYRSDNKISFMKLGWIDLLASIPQIDFFRGGRIIRFILILRIFKSYKTIHNLVDHLKKNKIINLFTSLVLLSLLVVIIASILILLVETESTSNIKSAEDAIWWSYTTITTVGYGDKYPVTSEGRLIAAVLMTIGVGLFGSFTGFIASWFVGEKK